MIEVDFLFAILPSFFAIDKLTLKRYYKEIYYILHHRSNKTIEKPLFDKGKVYNDYGQGFYCTEHIELAKEWVCNKGIDGFSNKYELDKSVLKIILHWLALLMKNRRFRVSTPVMRMGVQWLKDHFLIDISNYVLIIGYCADDSYFSFARAFISSINISFC